MAEPPPVLPQPSGVPVAAAPIHLMTSSIAGAQLVAPTSAPDHVAQNPSIGDPGEVESRAGASTAEVLPDAKILMEEDGVAGDGSTSLSTICARMIQSCTYTVVVKVCGSGTEINGNTCFSWQIIEGTSTNLKDLIACIAGTLSFPLRSEQNIYLDYVDCTSGKNISVSNDEECMKINRGRILPSVMKELNDISRGLDIEYERIDDMIAEVSESAALGGKRHITDLAKRTCTCCAFQIFGKPCKHEISFITEIRGVTIEDFVDDYYSVAKFTAAYSPILPGLTDMSQWPSVHKEFFLNPPILRRAPGRPKVQRHKSGAENSKGKGKNGQQQCPICKEFGHRWQSCKNAAPEALEAYAEVAKQKRNKRKKTITKAICTTSDQAIDGTVPPLPCTTETETALAIEDKTAKLTSPKTTSKSKRSKIISAAPDSPAMSTRSKKRAAPNSQPMATRRKRKFKL